MTITKKHLNELADIVYDALQKAETCTGPGDQDLEAIAREIKSFAQRHAPNFSESHWNDYMHKLERLGSSRKYLKFFNGNEKKMLKAMKNQTGIFTKQS